MKRQRPLRIGRIRSLISVYWNNGTFHDAVFREFTEREQLRVFGGYAVYEDYWVPQP